MAKKKEETGKIPANRADKFTWDEGDLVFETKPEEEKEKDEKDLAWAEKLCTTGELPPDVQALPASAQAIWMDAFGQAIRTA